MAEFVFKKLVNERGLGKDFYIYSRATSTEELGNDMDFRAKSTLRSNNIQYDLHIATQFNKNDYELCDYIFAMDGYNIENLRRITGGDKDKKINLLSSKEISDPWYTGNFQKAFDDIYKGCSERLEQIIGKSI